MQLPLKSVYGDNWVLHKNNARGIAKQAFVVTHGSHDDSSFTTVPAPAALYFYVMHGHIMYNIEINQLLNFQNRIRFGRRIVVCAPKDPISILGKGGLCWDYELSPWKPQDMEEYIQLWHKRRNSHTADLLRLNCNGPSSTLNSLFAILTEHGFEYEDLYLCFCRSVHTFLPNIWQKRQDAKNIEEVYTNKYPAF